MSLAFRFLGALYLKYFFILLLALETFFVGIDLLKFAEELPPSANLVVLFVVYDALYALNFILPIALVLAQILLFVVLLRTNELTALLSIGYSKRQITTPLLGIALLFTFGFIVLNATPFAYAKERVDTILDQGYVGNFKRELFVKYHDSYIYFDKIYPLLQKAEGVKVYRLEGDRVAQWIEAKEARFVDNHWRLNEAMVMTIPSELTLGGSPLEVEKVDFMEVLEGFRPRILDSIYERHGAVSIIDAIESMSLLLEQQVNSQKIRGILYSLVLFPFFAPLCMVLVAYYMPITMRYGNLAIIVFAAILGVLLFWGLFFALSRLSMSGFIHPEVSLLIPMILWTALALFFWRRLARL
ncbi:LptF/LptG family permease [Wolinella succinogenes]|uniref:Permease n=1 Tax=Wolinella succinogenes (strain ATCC 29543 / DSM 1740 / CCUG 13145 / JCM 31913 / LMG 7466 / NCTC 11488 / FDC 602W) TaxID=273121 RepID=Q7MQR0_WOLSU|nr:LptF/LptG family permease [Wolinella succinogenes]CAE11076.1 conserved hypothetical protein-PREDICTED PEMEASE [Wolinella succinogenes]VEG81241.1 lipopolysaccharide ABC transporter permease [Wolinella succinogenes]HCZ19135.1 YjgP/YjgQ family permease [Helicobacter sp.]